MKLTLKSHSNTRQVATDIYTVKYQTYLLQVLCDNLDSAVLDYLAPIDRLRMTATYETRLKLGNILRLAKSLRAALSEVCHQLTVSEELTGLSDGLNDMLMLFRVHADVSDEAVKAMTERLAATVKTVREGQALEEKCISLIEEQIVKPATNGTKQTQNPK